VWRKETKIVQSFWRRAELECLTEWCDGKTKKGDFTAKRQGEKEKNAENKWEEGCVKVKGFLKKGGLFEEGNGT